VEPAARLIWLCSHKAGTAGSGPCIAPRAILAPGPTVGPPIAGFPCAVAHFFL